MKCEKKMAGVRNGLRRGAARGWQRLWDAHCCWPAVVRPTCSAPPRWIYSAPRPRRRPAMPAPAPSRSTDVECPASKCGAAPPTLMIGSKPGEGEPSALDLRYQVTIVRTARECRVSCRRHDNEGRHRGTCHHRSSGWSRHGRCSASDCGGSGRGQSENDHLEVRAQKVASQAQSIACPFTHIDPDMSFPMPPRAADIDSYVVYVGFDPGGAPDKKKPAAKSKPKPKSAAEAPSKLNEAYHPRRSMIARLSARRSAITERAPAERRAVSS